MRKDSEGYQCVKTVKEQPTKEVDITKIKKVRLSHARRRGLTKECMALSTSAKWITKGRSLKQQVRLVNEH
jgi:hypothetical protein